jgi:hypothetical protein
MKPIRKAAIKRIADQKRVSFAVASHIYACKPTKVKQSLCSQEETRRKRIPTDIGEYIDANTDD